MIGLNSRQFANESFRVGPFLWLESMILNHYRSRHLIFAMPCLGRKEYKEGFYNLFLDLSIPPVSYRFSNLHIGVSRLSFLLLFFFGLSVIVLKRRKSLHDVHKATKRPKKGAGTQKPAIAPYKEPTQSKNSDNDKELSPIYNLTQSQKRFKKELLIV